jgi:hypothetical protein
MDGVVLPTSPHDMLRQLVQVCYTCYTPPKRQSYHYCMI